MTNENITPGEWQYDSMGRKFRKVGTCIEYATTINTTSGTFYQDEATERITKIKEQQKQKLKEQAARQAQEPQGTCPFKAFQRMINTRCDSKCAFYKDISCIFNISDISPIKDTKGSYCPFVGKCNDICSMYNDGCTFIRSI